jgi:hypothetical protein
MPGGTEEYHEALQSGESASRLKSQTSSIWRSANHYTTMFGAYKHIQNTKHTFRNWNVRIFSYLFFNPSWHSTQ